MSKKEILEKAIQKAIDGGWKGPFVTDYRSTGIHQFDGVRYYNKVKATDFKSIIFNHQFAKALWGDEPYHHVASGDAQHNKNGEIIGVRANHEYNWAYHLQQMVIAEDPIKYLEENL